MLQAAAAVLILNISYVYLALIEPIVHTSTQLSWALDLRPFIFQFPRALVVGLHRAVCVTGPADSLSVGVLHLGPDH